MSKKSPENFNDCGNTNEDWRDVEVSLNLRGCPEVDDEFARQVAAFVERYRPALEALAKR